jgi:hypothetical protein
VGGNVILEIPDDIAQLLMGWLEDEAEKHYIIPTDDSGDYDMDEAARQVFAGETAGNVEVLAMHDPPYAWILARLYDGLDCWPRRFDAERAYAAKEIIDQRCIEVMEENRRVYGDDDE